MVAIIIVGNAQKRLALRWSGRHNPTIQSDIPGSWNMIDHLAGRQKNPWAIEYSRLNSLIDAAASIEERNALQKALRDHCDTRFKPVVSQRMLEVQTERNAIADARH